MFKIGDKVCSSGKYENVNKDFRRIKYGIVVKIENVDLHYAGNQFVTVDMEGIYVREYYATALRLY